MNSTKPGSTGAALERAARRLSAEVLAPFAAEVDQTGAIPDSHFVALSDAGLFGAVNQTGATGTAQMIRAHMIHGSTGGQDGALEQLVG